MSSTNIEQMMPVKLAQTLAGPSFPALDSTSRSDRHIGLDKLNNHTFLVDFQRYLEEFYARYNIEFIRALKGFFCLYPRPTMLIPRPVLSELDMMIGEILCYLYLSPERLANEGASTQQELYDELPTLADEAKLLKLVNNHLAGSGVNRQELQGKVHSLLSCLHRLSMVRFMGRDSNEFRITESMFRFGIDVCAGNDPREMQRCLVRNGEAMSIGNHLQLNDETGESQPDNGEEE